GLPGLRCQAGTLGRPQGAARPRPQLTPRPPALRAPGPSRPPAAPSPYRPDLRRRPRRPAPLHRRPAHRQPGGRDREPAAGTPAYMAPELARGSQGEVQPASDQYSLGILLYELLCGQVPFAGPIGAVLSMHINQEPPAPHTLKPDLPKDLETICLKALAKRL